jgi:trimeric autotransporter adhesin
MAQSAITVTTPNPTPPTNMSFVGQTPPNAPTQLVVDDGSAGTLTVFAAKTASADNANFPSVDHEGKGTEVTVVAPGSRAEAPTVSFSDLGAYTTNPNRDHASTLSPLVNATLTSASGASNVSGAGTTLLTATGTGFNKQSVIWSNGIAYPTTFVSATSLTATAPKKATAGTLPVKVVTGGVIETATVNWTFT